MPLDGRVWRNGHANSISGNFRNQVENKSFMTSGVEDPTVMEAIICNPHTRPILWSHAPTLNTPMDPHQGAKSHRYIVTNFLPES